MWDNTAGAFFIPNDMTIYWKQPHSVGNIVLQWSSFASQIWWYPKKPSVKDYISWPPTPSRTSSVKGVGNESCTHASFNFLKSTQMRISPVFLSWTTIGLIHSDSSTGLMIPTSSIWLISTFTLSLYHGFSQYGLCRASLEFGFNMIFISPRSPKIPFVSENRVEKRSWNSCSRSVILAMVSSSQ